jgi:hypothetical protein
MKKKATVYSNDPGRPQFDLTVSGKVELFAQIKPAHVILRGFAGEPLRRRVTVVPSRGNPFKIRDVKAKHGENINYRWETRETPQGPTYIIEVENTRKTQGRYYDILFLVTDSGLRPQIPVQVRGSIAAQPEPAKKTP